MESTQPSAHPRPQLTIPTFEPYKTYFGIYDQKKHVIYDWLCKCEKAPDELDSVKCDNKECKFWGHKSCHGYSSDQDLTNVKHICDHCKSQPKRGRKKTWTTEDRKLLMKLKNEQKYEWIRISRALHRTIDECKNQYKIRNINKHTNKNNKEKETKTKNKYNLRERRRKTRKYNEKYNNINETVENSNNNSKTKTNKNKDYHCAKCGKHFNNGKAYGGHLGAHTKKEKKNNNNNFNDYSSDYSSDDNSVEVTKVIHKKRKRMKKRKSKSNILVIDDSDSMSESSSDSDSKKEENENELENEPPNKKMRFSDNNNNNNNNEEKWQTVTFKNWESEETIKFFEDTIHEFKILLENKKDGCNIRRDWKKSNMNGKNLVLMCENKANWALQSVGITDMGIQIKIMKSIQNKM